MSDTTNNGGPAFPASYYTDDGEWAKRDGMTLRDYFAAKAMPACYAEYCTHANIQGFDEGWNMGVALDAYAMADAMLKAREVKHEQG